VRLHDLVVVQRVGRVGGLVPVDLAFLLVGGTLARGVFRRLELTAAHVVGGDHVVQETDAILEFGLVGVEHVHHCLAEALDDFLRELGVEVLVALWPLVRATIGGLQGLAIDEPLLLVADHPPATLLRLGNHEAAVLKVEDGGGVL